MKYLIPLVVSLLIGVYSFSQPARHVVLISIDGLRPAMYLDSGWASPNLHYLMREGSYAQHMLSVFPSFTYPSHSSMVTGAYPAEHEVCHNAPFAPLGNDGHWNWYTNLIKSRTIWDAAHEANLTSATVEWPVSVGAPVNWNVPEIWPVKDGDDRVTESRKYATPGLIEDIEKNATGLLTRDNMNESYLSFDETAGRMADYIIQHYKPNLLALHFACVDGAEHEEGIDGDSVRFAVESVDRAIGEVLESIERAGIQDSTAVIVVGDHGFSDIHRALRPNIWLATAGLLHTGNDWGMMFQPAGGSAFLYMEHPEDTTQLKDVRAFINSQPDSIRNLFRVVERPELTQMKADKRAVMALAARPGVIFSGAIKGAVIFPVKGGHHGYDPNIPEMYTGFISAGAGIVKGKVIPEIRVVDIAPLVMKLLGVSFDAPDGVVPKDILR
ncbi:alkaline phosphatase family protein [Dinghuibacter silviterrae]|uniref:Putative AlkP superfamily pyrophosphatase or phosphodiesterase n=1 Tax=Dinghuibacter silviterrae TaxID=1539049 RepID=A0A4V3GM34_9BACT|nr:ectonucleotide pyrophosphatase/phosphodiesterase [Dinghuibacter silviterrae]TDX01833.1 putative AlkP superfamily pyrophosphatase or phosphodiesterase [Dinghuibacter silviterrae]